jgi:flavin reductase (DIM6/NTAB) family NADH-FMN oxidoreductase RutF
MERTHPTTANQPIVGLFRKLTLGVYVIGVTDGRTRDAFTAASVTQVSYRPLMLSLAIHPQHRSYPLLTIGKTWTVNVLSDNQWELARRFGAESAADSKMAGMSWGVGKLGAPFLVSALAYFDCRLTLDVPTGDHRIVVGSVMNGKVLANHAQPLRYDQTDDMDQSSMLYPEKFEDSGAS